MKKLTMTPFRIALPATAIPLSILTVLGVVANLDASLGRAPAIGAFGLVGAALPALIGFAIARKTSVAAGKLAGLAIGVGVGILAVGVSCFVALGRL